MMQLSCGQEFNLAAPVGGGTVVCPVFDNGTAWVVG